MRKPGIPRLIEALMRRGFEGSNQITLGPQSSHAGTRIFVLDPAAAIRDVLVISRLDHRVRLG